MRCMAAFAAAGLFVASSAAAQEPTRAPAEAETIEGLRQEDAEAYEAGDYERALRASTRVLELAKNGSGERSADFAQALADHAMNLIALERPAEAEPLYRRALETRTEVLGEKHPDTIATLNNLAANLEDSGRLAEAEPIYRRALALHAEVLGEKHETTIQILNNLAYNLNKRDRTAEAEPLYRQVLALKTEVLGEKHPETIGSLHNVAANLGNLGRYAEAEALYRRALALGKEVLGEKHPSTILTLGNLASMLNNISRGAEAEPLFRQVLAVRMEVLGEKHPDTLDGIHDVAANLNDLGRFVESDALYHRLLDMQKEVLGERHPSTLTTLSNLAVNLEDMGHSAEAEPLYRRVLTLEAEVLGEKHWRTITSLHNLGYNLSALGRSAEAEPLLRRALAMQTEVLGEKSFLTVTILKTLASTLDKLGRHSEAEPLHRRALELRSEAFGESNPEGLRTAGGLVRNLLLQPSRAALALQPARAAAEGWRLRRRTAGSGPREESQLTRDVHGQQKYFTLLADAGWSAAQARPAELSALRVEAFTALQDAMAGSTNQAIAQMAARHAAEGAGAGLGNLARERQSLSDRWRANEAAQTGALAESGPEARIKQDKLREEQATLEAEIARIDERLRNEAPQYHALVRPEPLELAAAQQLLAPDEAALIVVPTQFGTHVMALSREKMEWRRAELTESDVEAAVGKLRNDLTLVKWKPVISGFDRSTAHHLYQSLVAPVGDVIRGKRHLFIAAGGALSSLPFGVLVTAPPTGDDADPAALRSTSWLNDSHALIQLPSLQSLQFLRSFRARGNGGGGFMGFGDPLLQGNAVARGREPSSGVNVASVITGRQTRDGVAIADVSQLRQLARLPGTAVELENMRKALKAPRSSIRMGEASTESAVRAARLSESRIIAFATHGLVAGEIDGAGEPGLVFTPPDEASEGDDGFLTASEVTTLTLNAEWVILSACNTASGDGDGEPSLSGLARAFFYAGAKSLLASHWPVLDEVAARLTVDAITRQRRNPNLSRAEALQAAMIAIRNSPDNRTFAHPAAWAPFSLVGEGAR